MRKAFQKCVNNEILSMHYWKYNSICYIWNTRQIWHKTAMKSTWKENNTHSVHQRRFPPHHRPSQSTPAWPSEKSSICSQVTSVRPHHSVNKQKQLFYWLTELRTASCAPAVSEAHQAHAAHSGQHTWTRSCPWVQTLLTEEEIEFVVILLGAVSNLFHVNKYRF